MGRPVAPGPRPAVGDRSGVIAETDALVHAPVPLAAAGRDGAVPTGATNRAAPGAVLTQLPAGAKELAETLVHETHHTKLAALDDSASLLPGPGAPCTVAWRPDPRPPPRSSRAPTLHLPCSTCVEGATSLRCPRALAAARPAERFRAGTGNRSARPCPYSRGSDELTCSWDGTSCRRCTVAPLEPGTAVRNST